MVNWADSTQIGSMDWEMKYHLQVLNQDQEEGGKLSKSTYFLGLVKHLKVLNYIIYRV